MIQILAVVIGVLLTALIGFMLWNAKQFIKQEAEKDFKTDLKELKDSFAEKVKEINERILAIENNYVTCKSCVIQHEGVNKMFKSIDGKLDILIQNK